MDNLIHASANAEDAEREVKLWFMPSDIPPPMHAYATEMCETYYYYKKGKLYTTQEPNSICLLAPGAIAWASDIEILRRIGNGDKAGASLESVAAKYLINDYRMDS